jgi:hypothetical protein
MPLTNPSGVRTARRNGFAVPRSLAEVSSVRITEAHSNGVFGRSEKVSSFPNLGDGCFAACAKNSCHTLTTQWCAMSKRSTLGVEAGWDAVVCGEMVESRINKVMSVVWCCMVRIPFVAACCCFSCCNCCCRIDCDLNLSSFPSLLSASGN